MARPSGMQAAALDDVPLARHAPAMDLAALSRRALEIRSRYAVLETAHGGQPWSRAELAQGFVGDVGALMKLVMAKDGRRVGPPDLDARLAHELADCLWSVLVLADTCGVDLERAFGRTMDELDAKLAAAEAPQKVSPNG